MEIFLKLLGAPKVILGQETQVLPSDKRGALLAYLAFQKDWVSREQLAFLFWPDSDQGTALANLRQLLRRSKQLPHATDLDIEPEQVRWQVITDVANFQKNLYDQDWLKSIENYQDHFLNTFTSDSPGFEAWLDLERSNLKLSWQEAAFKVTENLSKTDRASEAANLLLQLWRLSDYDESFLQRYLKQAYAAGQRSIALAAFATFREQLLKTFEVDVSSETQELIQAINNDSLKPEKLSSPSAKPQPKRSSQPLLGRQQELSELTDLLKNSECRALCLTGPGGVGKTRLAQELAKQCLADFEHGICFVPLASISKPEEIINAIVSALSFTFYGRTEPKVQLANYLRNKTMLLLVDNLEHVFEGASLLAELLAEAPELTLLITSRQLPELAEVWPFALQGLAYEQPGSDAENLFIQLAKKQQPRFQANEAALEYIRQICKLVEGLPLAIELAASWVRELSPREILEQLGRSFEILKRDGQRQHDSMQAVFEYSWQLLSPEQQTLSAQLSVFRGGFTSAAAETVAGATPYLLLSLQNRSLLIKDEAGRYGMHELVRQYAAEKLRFAEIEVSTYDRHAGYFSELLITLDKELSLGQFNKVTDAIAIENANVGQSLEWLIKQQKWSPLLESVGCFSHFLNARGLYREGEIFFSNLVKVLHDYSDTHTVLLRARAESLLGLVCTNLGQSDRAQTLFEQSLPILEQYRYAVGLTSTYHNLGMLYTYKGNYDQAEAWHQKSYDLCEEIQDMPGIANTLNSMGVLSCITGKLAEGIERFQRGLELTEKMGNRETAAHLLNNLGSAFNELGNITASEEVLQKAHRYAEEIQKWSLVSICLDNLAEAAFVQGKHESARELRQQGLALARQLGYRRSEATCVVMMGYDASRLEQLNEAQQHFLEGLGLAQTLSHKDIMLNVLIGLAELAIKTQKSETGLVNLIFAAEHPSTQGEARKRAKELLQQVETRVSSNLFETARQQAQTLDLEQVVREILEQK